MSVLERKDASRVKDIDKHVKNKFRWDWMERTITDIVGKKEVTILFGDFIRKIDRPGKVLCTWCQDNIEYGSRGFKALEVHAKRQKHMKQLEARKTNISLAGTLGCQPKVSKTYGLDPLFTSTTAVDIERKDPPKQPTSVADRVVKNKKRQTAPKRQADPPHKKSRQSLGRKIQTLLGSSCSDDEEPSHLFAPIGDSDIESSDMDSMDHVSWRCLTSGSMKMITNVIKPFVSSLSCTFSSVFQVRSLLSYQIVKACTLTLAKLWMTVAVSYTGMWFQVLRSAHIAIYMRNYSN
ncbi:uncharacterized protein LOC133538062 isoform X1 [Nerophis ophidion]|uniref:uncharacterized protein LOC133538062 isoform X1 n=1 Tax=Nerophis ophidion TaxID=159077 RepID=UPI002ADF645D|nr:uncharacterized protein LOC133538062 isoform X1 [Nerophis ophidion]